MKPDILKKLIRLEDSLRKAVRYPIPSDGQWAVLPPARGGVYAIWKGAKAVYVGETCHLDHRLGDIARFRRHAFWHRLISPKAAAEDLQRYRVSFIAGFLGRKELEEFLTVRWLGKVPGRLSYCDDIEQIRNA